MGLLRATLQLPHLPTSLPTCLGTPQDNILVHMEPHATAGDQDPRRPPLLLPRLKLGDLNGAQWDVLTREGHYWMGTAGYMTKRWVGVGVGGWVPNKTSAGG